MIIIYTPEGGEPERYDARSLRVSEASIVQRTVGMKWAEVKEGLSDEDQDAMRGVVWVLKKRSNPSLRFGEFDPGIEEMVTRLDTREAADYIDGAFRLVGTEPEMTRESVAHALREMPQAADDPEHAERLIAELAKDPKDQEDQEVPGEEEDGEPSEPPSPSPTSTSPETSTSDSSPTSATSPPPSSTT
ncbi:hypothetical protein [Streptomyces sp. B21-083]|uniref:hypothetical protein n=1 Tax=Streptomyces sp. B21-083 TaxID=3039410 RepID=UPI002FF21D60